MGLSKDTPARKPSLQAESLAQNRSTHLQPHRDKFLLFVDSGYHSEKVLSSIGFAVFTVVMVPVVFAQETAEVLPPPAKIQVDFTRHVEPIFKKRCQACHGAQQQMNGLRLDRSKDALKGGYSGVVIQPGDSASSKLIRLVAGVVPKTTMPPAGPKLTTEEIGILRAWI